MTIKLIQNIRDIRFLILTLSLMLILSLAKITYLYYTISSQSTYVTIATVDKLSSYLSSKTFTPYTIATFSTPQGLSLSSIINQPLHINQHVTLTFPTHSLQWTNFFQTTYITPLSIIPHPLTPTFLQSSIGYIDKQHSHPLMKELYLALFFDMPMSATTQHIVSHWGLAALLSLSGLNILILWGILYATLSLIYTPFQNSLFPYRNRLLDINYTIIVLLGCYVVLTDYNPSFFRAWVAGSFAFILKHRLMNLSPALLLCLTTLFLLALFPTFITSLGFWFSVLGVSIILTTSYYLPQNIFSSLVIGIFVFVGMIPFVNYFFPSFSPWQITSIITNLLFDYYYPLTLFLHLLGIGGIGDDTLATLLLTFSTSPETIHLKTPLWFLIISIILLIGSFFSLDLFVLWSLCSFSFLGWGWVILG